MEKRLQSLEKNNYKGCTFQEAKSLYEHYGFTVKNKTGGSHYSLNHPSLDKTIILPNHPGSLLKPYVKTMCEAIREVKNNDWKKFELLYEIKIQC